MSEPYYGEINIFPYTFAPYGWAYCNGSNLSIAQFGALYAVIGTTYGGSGVTNFQIPNLLDKVPLGWGSAPGLVSWQIGGSGGYSSIALSQDQLPTHTHEARASMDTLTNESEPTELSYPAFMDKKNVSTIMGYKTPGANLVEMDSNALCASGSSYAHENRQPVLCMNYYIALEGVWPSRP